MPRCACDPGTYENGWRETRCKECLAAERAAWAQMLEKLQLTTEGRES